MAFKRLKADDRALSGISAQMQRLGFSDYETRSYIQLLRENPATAYEISKAAGVPRANAYNALDSLAQRGVVQPISEDPVRYAPVDPTVVFDRISHSTSELCEELKVELAKISKPEDRKIVWTLRGETAVHDKVTRMIISAQERIWIKASDDVVRLHRKEIEAASDRGVEILIVLFGSLRDSFSSSDRVHVVLHEGTGKRLGTADNLFTVAVDHEEVLTANVEESVHAAYTSNSSIVTMALSLIRHEFYLSEIFVHLNHPLEATFGPHLLKLREQCFTPVQLDVFKNRMGLS